MPIYNPPPTAVPTAHHTTHETGGTDLVAAIDGSVITSGSVAAARGGTGTTTGLTVLSASNVTTGTLPVAQLPATVARTDVSNIFNGNQYIQGPTGVNYYFVDASQPANLRNFDIYTASQQLVISAMNDAGSQVAICLLANRLGDVQIGRDIYEKQRTTPLGHWIDIPFVQGNFTTDVGTWSITGSANYVHAYTVIGKTMVMAFMIETTSVSGSPTTLRIALPSGYVLGRWFGMGVAANNSGVAITAAMTGQVGLTYLAIAPSILGGTWTTSTNNTGIRFIATFAIQ